MSLLDGPLLSYYLTVVLLRRSPQPSVHKHTPPIPTMSFLGGAECSTGANPLSQFSKHVQDDKSLQRDRLVGRGPGGLQESMRTQAMGGPTQDGVRHYMYTFQIYDFY